MALPAYVLYRDIYRETKSARWANTAAFWYLANPTLHSTNLYDFHTQSLMLLPTYLFARELHRGNLKKAALYLALLFTITEQAAIVGVGAAFCLLTRGILERRLWLKAIAAVTLTTAAMTAVAYYTISTFGKPPVSPTNPTSYFPQLGNSWGEVLANLPTPKLIDALKHDIYIKAAYWLITLFPLYLWSPRRTALDTIPHLAPWMAVTLLAGYHPLYTLGWHLPAWTLGIMAESVRQIATVRKISTLYILAIAAAAAVLSPASPLSHHFLKQLGKTPGAAYDFNPYDSLETKVEMAKAIEAALAHVPPHASVFTTTNIFPHVAARLEAYVTTPPQPPEYIILDYRFIHFTAFGQHPLNVTRQLTAYTQYGVVMSIDGVLLLKRNYTGPPLAKKYHLQLPPSRLAWRLTPTYVSNCAHVATTGE
ncbi:MAG: DUF2079 domain-containing protein, partial [Pyrobaculum sp.]